MDPVAWRPEWVFVKVYAHGAPEWNAQTLLGPETAAFHRDLLAAYNDGTRYRLHYVTTREMVNIIHAAEVGRSGNAGAYREYAGPFRSLGDSAHDLPFGSRPPIARESGLDTTHKDVR